MAADMETIISVINKKISANLSNPQLVARAAGLDPELFSRSLAGNRKLKADELVAVCKVLPLNISDFSTAS